MPAEWTVWAWRAGARGALQRPERAGAPPGGETEPPAPPTGSGTPRAEEGSVTASPSGTFVPTNRRKVPLPPDIPLSLRGANGAPWSPQKLWALPGEGLRLLHF